MCLTMRKTAGGKSKKEELLTCNSSACPARLLLCLVRRFINRTNRGGPDGCYDTIICFRGSPSSSWALFCCLFAACRSSPPRNTHSRCKGECSSPDTQMVFTRPLNYQQLGPPLSPINQEGGAPLCFSVCMHARTRTHLTMQSQLSTLLSYIIG